MEKALFRDIVFLPPVRARTISDGILPIALHYDPRFVTSEQTEDFQDGLRKRILEKET